MKKDLSPGKWDAVHGGRLAPGQDERDGALQELFEEIGITMRKHEIEPPVINQQDGKLREFQYVFPCALRRT